jgi:DeoR family glycerol-3-phosphate regulon repressor
MLANIGQNHMVNQVGQLSARQSELLRAVRERGAAALADLAREFNVSQETIRRDVKRLAAEGQVLRRHGNVAVPYSVGEAPFERRLRENAAAKRAIARRAAEMVEDGDSIILDTGTTTSIFARELLKRANLTVITNSSDIARTLATVNGNRVYMAGGELNGDNGAAFGPSTIDFVAQFRAKHAMVTIAGLTAELGPMDSHLAEAEFARMVLSRGENRVILTDHSKFERMALIKICEFEDFNRIVTDIPPPTALAERLSKAGIRLEIAGPDAH